MSEYDSFREQLSRFQFPLSPSGKVDFWKIAHQKAAYSIPQMLNTLDSSNRSQLTVRNTMEYRYLGLIKISEGLVSDTQAGLAFTNDEGENHQRILDCQIAKLWLANPTNPRLQIEVSPLLTICRILLQTRYLTWDEYLLVVIWIKTDAQVPEAVGLIEEIRKLSQSEISGLFRETELKSGRKDIADQASRPWKIVANHSLVQTGIGNRIELSRSAEETNYYVDNASKALEGGLRNYEDFLFTALNLNSITSEPSLTPLGLEYREVFLRPVENSVVKQAPGARAVREIDYEALQAAQARAGAKAEKFVLASERRTLQSLDRDDLADKVTQVSLVNNGLGYDIVSFDADGSEFHIEVKSVSRVSGNCSIFISENEVRVAKSTPQWRLYIVMGNGTSKPYIWDAKEVAQAVRDLDLSRQELTNGITASSPQFQIQFCVSSDMPSIY